MKVGIDEVGRGAFAGPVYVCCFGTELSDSELLSLFPDTILRDSKKLTRQMREAIYEKLAKLREEQKVSWAIGKQEANFIDEHGLTKAITTSLETALLLLRAPKESEIFLDGGLKAPKEFGKQTTIIKGDEKIPVIACASIVAKVLRDRYMGELSKEYPEYGFLTNVGYGTKSHAKSLKKFGKTKEHRSLFLRKLTLLLDKRPLK